MTFQIPITISSVIKSIERNEYLLPAIQREFVWSHRQIEWLFDSIMQGYPISSFLFWRVEGSTKADYKFYQFLKEYKQRYGTHNKEFSTAHHMDFTAVLDGQQRLTSLYIGLCGSYAYRKPRVKEANTDIVYPPRYLCLNIEESLKNNEDGKIFEFKFLKETDIMHSQTSWFKVSEIYSLSNFFDFNQYLNSHNISSEFAQRTLASLHEVIHTKNIINFFLEKDQNIDKALNIFIRINSGGEKLNSSDLIMSFAVANWERKDARREIHNLVDNIKDKGFSISKDFVLKTFLYLYSKDIKFKVANFSKENAIEFEREWVNIRDTILSVFDLVKSFGFNDFTLTSKNALIPIIYYLYHKKIYTYFDTKVAYSDDRTIVKKWLHVILIKRVFGNTSDNVLTQIRRAFTSDISKVAIEFDTQKFPIDSINSNLRKDIGITDEFIEDILLTQKDDIYAFSILALLYPNLDYKNNDFEKDHLHPISKYECLSEDLKKQYGLKNYNSLKNLQMLDANENASKNNGDLSSWVEKETKEENAKDRISFLKNHLIPDVDLGLDNFDEFITKRTEMLHEKLKKILT